MEGQRATVARALWLADGYDLDADPTSSTAREMRPEYLTSADAVLAALGAERDRQVQRWVAGVRCALLHWQAEGVTKAVSCANCQSWAASIAMPFFRALTDSGTSEGA